MTNNIWHKFDSTFSDLAKFDKYFIGSDSWSKRLSETAELLANTASNVSYPPFNLKKVDDNKYVIEMAVAGFGKQDIEMTLEDNKLIVKGQTTMGTLLEDGQTTTTQEQYLHKGISDRAFARTFTLADNVVVNNAGMVNGLLKIWLEHIIPEHKKPRKIDINESSDSLSLSKKGK